VKRLLALSLLVTPALFAAETHRYIVATAQPARLSRLHVLSTPAEAAERNVRAFESIDGFAVDLTDAEAAEMRKSAGVRYVSRTIAVHAVGDIRSTRFAPRPAASPMAKTQTIPPGIDALHARDVWPLTRGGNVNIAIFDTGVDVEHADLAANIAGGYNTLTKKAERADYDDDNYHGTHVAGTIGALDNGLGVAGVAPGAHIYAVKVLDAFGGGTDETMIAATDWVLAMKAAGGGNWIVSMSVGSVYGSVPEAEAFHRLTAAGVLCIAAAGNDSSNQLLYPAALPDVVSVGAVDANNVIADFSNYGPTLNVVAPGVSVLSTLPTGYLQRASTTLADGTVMTAQTIIGAQFNDVTAEWVYCSYGGVGDFPAEVRGKIAVVVRGMELSFSEKVRHARDAGAIGVAIINNTDSRPDTGWTLIRSGCDSQGCRFDPGDLAYPWPVAVAMSKADGAKLIAAAQAQTITISAYKDDYGFLSGTSMATPHVTGAAALAWSLAPAATAKQVAAALRASAADLGPPGVDDTYGFGLVNARAAAQWLAPAAFGLPARPDERHHGVRH
jgi:subtilisin family serine protease